MAIQIFREILNKMLANKKKILEILLKIENNEEANFEFKTSISALSSPQKYYNQINGNLSVFLPMNLPLYSLILYVVIPRICCNNIYYRPSNITIKISKKLHEILKLNKYKIHLVDANRNLFLEQYAKQSEVVIFTGKPNNAEIIKKHLSSETLFLYFGCAQNPIVVERDANLNKACEVIYESVIFNYGQDCAKPNVILVNASVADKLIKMIVEKIKKEGNNRKTSIKDSKEIIKVTQLLVENRSSIIYGGNIECAQATMEPLVLSMYLKKDCKHVYEEFYAPVFKFLIYDSNEELKLYFENDNYKKQEMTITIFGKNNYVENIKNSIILFEETINQMDSGNIEFGGFGYNVSYLDYYGINIAKPLMINREISYFFNNTTIIKNINLKYKTTKQRKRELIIQLFKDKIIEIFDDNLVIAFIFGAYAKSEETQTSDVDIFIGIKDENKEQIKNFRKWYFEIHYMFGLIPDFYFPAEIITIDELSNILKLANTVQLQLYNNLHTYNTIFYTQILIDKKVYLFGSENSIDIEKYNLQDVAINWCKQTAKILINSSPDIYSKYSNKFHFFQPNKDLLTISSMLNYQIPSNEKYLHIINELDDGLFSKLIRVPPKHFENLDK